MTYTTQQLQEMEDAEINEAIAKKLGMVINSYCGDAVMCGYEGLRSTFADRDFCNNPNGIMPLAFERGISINFCPHLDAWTASAWKKTGRMESTMINSFRCDTNPLRAIACILLMMDE